MRNMGLIQAFNFQEVRNDVKSEFDSHRLHFEVCIEVRRALHRERQPQAGRCDPGCLVSRPCERLSTTERILRQYR